MWKYLTVISSIIIHMYGISIADSLWSDKVPSMYNPIKHWSIGDVITVHVIAESSAIQEAGTRTDKRSDLTADFYNLWDNYASEASNYKSNREMRNYRLGGNDRFSGVGKTTRKSRVKTIITCIITEVLPNGHLIVVGERQVNVNDDTETIRISGVIRSQDVTPENVVFSHQIAQLQVSLKGQGTVSSKQTPGILSRMFNWVF